MPTRPDEEALWAAFGATAEHRTPREAGQALGIPTKRVAYLCEKWAQQGRYDYGVIVDLGWKTADLD